MQQQVNYNYKYKDRRSRKNVFTDRPTQNEYYVSL